MRHLLTPLLILLLASCVRAQTTDPAVTATGIPAYPTGPFPDGNPSQAEDQGGLYRFPRNPQLNTGTPDATTGDNIGLFINGVALFDYRDGTAWNPNTNALCGGPGNPTCPGGPAASQDWNRDAIPAERDGFDCAKGHPARGNYHDHQNPSAFKLDLEVTSDICNLYDAEGLYAIDSTTHAPLIGFAYDGFPIYGAYGFYNAAADLVAVQLPGLITRDYTVGLHDASGRLVRQTTIRAGQTIAYFDTQTLYQGVYFVRIAGGMARRRCGWWWSEGKYDNSTGDSIQEKFRVRLDSAQWGPEPRRSFCHTSLGLAGFSSWFLC